MPTIDDIIKKLPDEIQEMVRAHIVTVVTMKLNESQEFINMLMMRHFNGAYQMLNDRMLPADRLTEQVRLNRMMVEMNIENKAAGDMWRSFFAALVSIAIQNTSKKLIGGN